MRDGGEDAKATETCSSSASSRSPQACNFFEGFILGSKLLVIPMTKRDMDIFLIRHRMSVPRPPTLLLVRSSQVLQASSTRVRRSSPYLSIPMPIIFTASFSPNFCSSGPQIEDWCLKQSIRLFLLSASVVATWHSRRLCLVGKLTSSLWCWWHGSSHGQCISPLRCRCHVVLCKNKNSNVEPILDKAREVHIPCFYFSYSLTWCCAHLVSTRS